MTFAKAPERTRTKAVARPSNEEYGTISSFLVSNWAEIVENVQGMENLAAFCYERLEPELPSLPKISTHTLSKIIKRRRLRGFKLAPRGYSANVQAERAAEIAAEKGHRNVNEDSRVLAEAILHVVRSQHGTVPRMRVGSDLYEQVLDIATAPVLALDPRPRD